MSESARDTRCASSDASTAPSFCRRVIERALRLTNAVDRASRSDRMCSSTCATCSMTAMRSALRLYEST